MAEPMNCYQVQLNIDNYLDERLADNTRREFIAHTLTCDGCRAELELARRLHRDLPTAAPYSRAAGVMMTAAQRARVRNSIVSQKRRGSSPYYGLLAGTHHSTVGQLALNMVGVTLILFVVMAASLLVSNLRPGPPPPSYQASFVYAQKQGLTYIFTDTTSTSDPLTYRWDFGDGVTDTLHTAEHTFKQPASYMVSLTVHGQNSSDGYKSVFIKVEDASSVTASATPFVTATPTPPTRPINAPTQPLIATNAPIVPPQPTISATSIPAKVLPPTATPLRAVPSPLSGTASITPSDMSRPTTAPNQPMPVTTATAALPTATMLPTAIATATPVASATALPVATLPPPTPTEKPAPTMVPPSVPTSQPPTVTPHPATATAPPSNTNTATATPTSTATNTPTPIPPSSTPVPPTATNTSTATPTQTPPPAPTQRPSPTPHPTNNLPTPPPTYPRPTPPPTRPWPTPPPDYTPPPHRTHTPRP